ncbi:MAG: S41 family peptidase, partial [Chloroflexota bacterium]
MKAARYLLLSLTLIVLLGASFVAGSQYGAAVIGRLDLPGAGGVPGLLHTSTEPRSVAPTFSLFWEAWNVVTHNFVDTSALNVRKMTWGAISGMIDSLGDTGHSRFLTPVAYEREQRSLRGQFVGIGAEVAIRGGRPVVIRALPGSPAEKAGVKAGDTIISVDGTQVEHLGLNALTDRIQGKAGTSVTLGVMRAGAGGIRKLTITRAAIVSRPVSSALLPGTTIMDVRLSSFSSATDGDLKAALRVARQAHATGLVLDLRDNPGGLLNQAVDVASQFMDRGTVVIVQ